MNNFLNIDFNLNVFIKHNVLLHILSLQHIHDVQQQNLNVLVFNFFIILYSDELLDVEREEKLYLSVLYLGNVVEKDI